LVEHAPAVLHAAGAGDAGGAVGAGHAPADEIEDGVQAEIAGAAPRRLADIGEPLPTSVEMQVRGAGCPVLVAGRPHQQQRLLHVLGARLGGVDVDAGVVQLARPVAGSGADLDAARRVGGDELDRRVIGDREAVPGQQLRPSVGRGPGLPAVDRLQVRVALQRDEPVDRCRHGSPHAAFVPQAAPHRGGDVGERRA
jgi:hypothetical protein